jgi:enoyl-CoA hydratase
MESSAVLYATAEPGIARLTLNRPARHNAIDAAMLDDLARGLDRADADPEVRCVVLAGTGRSFCSGWDTAGSPYITPPEDPGRWTKTSTLRTMRTIEARYRQLWDFPKPTVARVHGNALAGGCYLQLLCDISIAATDARLGHPAQRWGGVSSMPLWQVALPVKKARYLLLTGRIVDGVEAERMGLVSLAVPPEELDEVTDGVARDCATVPTAGMQHNKEALNTALDLLGVGALFRYHGQMNALGRLDSD